MHAESECSILASDNEEQVGVIVQERGRTFTGIGYPYPKATRNCQVNDQETVLNLSAVSNRMGKIRRK